MTGSAPISFNTAAESRDWVSAKISCGFALRRRTSARPIAPLAPAIRILIPLPFQAASRSLVVDGGFDAVIGDDIGDQPRRLGLARIGANDVVGVGRLGPGLASAVDADGLALDLGPDGTREDIRVEADLQPEAAQCPGQDPHCRPGGLRPRRFLGASPPSRLRLRLTVAPSPVEAAWPSESRSDGTAHAEALGRTTSRDASAVLPMA